jgi:uncharacterized protein YndB with AHSA1/START domain
MMRPAGFSGPMPAVELRRTFRAPADRVFRAWTQPAALREWWCPPGWMATEIAIDLRIGGDYAIAMRRIGGGDEIAVRGRFLEIAPPLRLVFTWRWEGAFANSPETTIVLELREIAGMTELVLRHEGFAENGIRQQHWSGWLAACDRLDDLLTASRR